MITPIKRLVQTIHSNQRLGRVRPVAPGPRLMFANYRLKTLPAAPADVDYSVAPAAYLKQVLLNDKLGCCTASGAFHVGGSLLANASEPIPFNDNHVAKVLKVAAPFIMHDSEFGQGVYRLAHRTFVEHYLRSDRRSPITDRDDRSAPNSAP